MREAKIIEIFEEGNYNHGDVQPDKAKRIDIYTDEDDGYGFNFAIGIRQINESSIDRFISKLKDIISLGYKISFAFIEESEYNKHGTKSIFGE